MPITSMRIQNLAVLAGGKMLRSLVRVARTFSGHDLAFFEPVLVETTAHRL
jgi:hypothetical protein